MAVLEVSRGSPVQCLNYVPAISLFTYNHTKNGTDGLDIPAYLISIQTCSEANSVSYLNPLYFRLWGQ
jgi:hypothetical protein